MSCFKLPDYLCTELEGMIRKFWWGGVDGKKKMNWISWDKLCARKQVGGLGFRLFKAFNLALLAKQIWRLAMNKETLLFKVFSSKYFKEGDVFKAQLGARPSFAWRSIFSSLEVIQEGSRWRVGNGRTIKIWRDRWLPIPWTFKIQTPVNSLSLEATVSECIILERCKWNEDLIDSVFWPQEARAIKEIPLGSSLNPDKLIWHYTRNGKFTVRSAYHLIIDRAIGTRIKELGSTSDGSAMGWKFLWDLKIPNKIKHFAWRVCHEAIPVQQTLQRRGMMVHEGCWVCGSIEESIEHVLCLCPFARLVWAISGIAWYGQIVKGSSMRHWWHNLEERLDSESFELVIVICWLLWKNRNDIKHQGHRRGAEEIVLRARENRLSFLNVQEPHTSLTTTVVPMVWTPPSVGYWKVNFDGAVFSEKGAMGVGIVVRNHAGEFYAAMSKFIPIQGNAEHAEFRAVWEAVIFALEAGFGRVIFEGDAELVIRDIQNGVEQHSIFGHFVDDVWRYCTQLEEWDFQVIRRPGNEVAHVLARKAKEFDDYVVWLEDPPPFLHGVLQSDKGRH